MRITVANVFSSAVGFFLGGLIVPALYLHSSSYGDCLDAGTHLNKISGGGGGVDDGRQDCVCGEMAQELRRLALGYRNRSEPALKVSLKVEPPESDLQMREYMFPSNEEPVLNYKDMKRQQHKSGHQYETLQQEYFFKKIPTLFVGVLTQQAYLPTRARHLYETWGCEVDKLIFFVGEDCVVPKNLSHLPIVKLEGVSDNVYPPLRKTFAVIKYMYENYVNQYSWFIRADDDMYMRIKRLNEMLAKLNPEEKVYLGRSGTGRKDDLERLRLLPHERYCMGGPGIILSVATLRHLGPHLTNCLNAGTHNITSHHITSCHITSHLATKC